MKIVKTANGKQTIKMSKKEWEDIGKTAGWIKTAQADSFHETEELILNGKILSSYGEKLIDLADLAYDGFDDDIINRNAILMKSINNIIENMSLEFRKMEDIMTQIDKLQAKGYGDKGSEVLPKEWSE